MRKIIVENRQGVFVIPIEEIVYMEKHLRKICVHTVQKNVEFYGRFLEVLPFLDDRFMYCHRSYVINMDQIVWMTANVIYLGISDQICFGRDVYRKARKIFTRYMSEKRPEGNWSVRMWL